MKICSRCNNTKTLDEFNNDRKASDGKQSACRECMKIAKAKYRQNNREEINRRQREKWPERAEKSKQYREEHKERYAELWQVWYEEHKEEKNAYDRNWSKENPAKVRQYGRERRARELGAEGSHTREDIDQMLVDQNGLCAYCECDILEEFQVDHIIPLSKGGTNNWSNIALCCAYCNRSKKDRPVEVYMELIL